MSSLNSIGTLLRLLLIALLTVMIDTTGTKAGYLVLAGLLLIATLGIIISMRILQKQVVSADTIVQQCDV